MTCATDLQKLYDAIIAASSGQKVVSSGHKDKQVGFNQSNLSEMIKIYRQLYAACGASSGLPEFQDLSQPTAKRGRPVRPCFGGSP